MKKVIFWHTYLAGDYKLVVQEQMLKLFTSGLYDDVEYIFTSIAAKSKSDIDWFLNLLNDYKKFFPIVLEDSSGEKPTMRLLCNYAKENDCYIMYFHTKAVATTGYFNTLWRLSQDYNMIYRWRDCIKYLDEGYDAVGCNLRKDTYVGYYPHYSGGSWWTSSKYIKTLDENFLYDKTLLGHQNPMLVEFFIGSNHSGKLKSVFECKHEAPYKVECLINEYVKI